MGVTRQSPESLALELDWRGIHDFIVWVANWCLHPWIRGRNVTGKIYQAQDMEISLFGYVYCHIFWHTGTFIYIMVREMVDWRIHPDWQCLDTHSITQCLVELVNHSTRILCYERFSQSFIS